MANFTYMGSKKLLAPRIAELVGGMASGPFLDLFSGIAAVGSAVGMQRPIWCNDVQAFSTLLTEQKFCSHRTVKTAAKLIEIVAPHFILNRHTLEIAFAEALRAEELALSFSCINTINELISQMAIVGRGRRDSLRAKGVHCLLITTHGGTYFGLHQAMELDSIRYAADKLLTVQAIGQQEHDLLVLTLCKVISTVNNSTGHFAQYLSPSATNISRIIRKRRMNVWSLWTRALLSVEPLGTASWRRRNKVFKSDANTLLKMLSKQKRHPAVIYADPPYTSDQYSRYYHLLENAVLYDYPETSGKGQYRPDRFTSGFSLKASVENSFEDMIIAAAGMKSVFILSYPKNGLLRNSNNRLLEMLSRHFRYVEDPLVVSHMHSTMGGSKGASKQAVEENIFVAYQNTTARYRNELPSMAIPFLNQRVSAAGTGALFSSMDVAA